MFLQRLYKLYLSPDRHYIQNLNNMLGFVPSNLALYKLAFKHSSAAIALRDGFRNSNERLEFLGDAIIGAVVGEILFKKYPYRDEGFLTEMRSKIVNRNHLNQLAHKMGLNEFIEYDAKMINASQQKVSMLGDAFEAMIGAVYLDKGYNFTKDLIRNRIITPMVDIDLLEALETNFKSRLIEWCQRHGKDVIFELIPTEDGSRSRLFTVKVLVDNIELGLGQDFSKKNAEKIAAEKACEVLLAV
jgi:ribonuclease-3